MVWLAVSNVRAFRTGRLLSPHGLGGTHQAIIPAR